MRTLALALIATIATATIAFNPAARAADDTYVSAAGADAGDCTVAAPCASLRYALKQTTPGGTIVVLTSGRYGPVNITQSVHIVAKGVQAILDGVASCKGTVCINAGPTDVVSLSGLTLDPRAYPNFAIAFYSGASLHVERCVTEAVSGFGIYFNPSSAATLHVFNSTIAAQGEAILVAPVSGIQRVVLDHATLKEALHGLVFEGQAAGEMRVTLRNSVISGVGGSAVLTGDDNASEAQLMIDGTVLANGYVGIDARGQGSLSVRMGDSTVTGFEMQSGVYDGVKSHGTNRVVGNGDDSLVDGQPMQTIPLK